MGVQEATLQLGSVQFKIDWHVLEMGSVVYLILSFSWFATLGGVKADWGG